MRIRARLGLHLLLLLGPVALAAACGTDAIGIDACQKIEQFRCDLAPYCAAGTTEEDTASCKVFYRDQCQHGLENNERTPSNGEVDACLDALNRAASCHVSGRATLAECPDIALASGIVGSAVAPCTLVMEHPEYLAACAFIAKPLESLPTPDAGGGAGGATGTGGAGGGT
jgi:hypothetical protein